MYTGALTGMIATLELSTMQILEYFGQKGLL